MPGQVCLDASIIIKLFLPEADSDKAARLIELLQGQRLEFVAPSLLTYEVISAFHKNVAENYLTPEQGHSALALFAGRRFSLFLPDALHELAWELADRCGQVVLYDAYYLALAETLDCDYWTADQRFYTAALPHSTRVHLLRDYAA